MWAGRLLPLLLVRHLSFHPAAPRDSAAPLMRWILCLLLVGCPESIRVATDGGSPGADAGPDRGDGGAGADGSVEDAGFGDDAGRADSGGDPGCMTDFMNRVQVPSPNGEGRFATVRGLAFDRDRNLYVLSRTGPSPEGFVTVLSPAPDHDFIRTYGQGEMGLVRDIAVDDDRNSYVVDWDHMSTAPPVLRKHTPSGTLTTFELTEPNMQNDEAYAVAVDQTTLYVSGLVLFRYRTDGSYVDFFGTAGAGPGEVLLPTDVEYDPRGYLWVADLYRNRVHQYDLATGQLVLSIGGRGTQLGEFDGGAEDGVYYGPTRVVVDASGDLIVNDPWSSRLQKLDSLGTPLGEFSFGGSREIGPLAIEPSSGNIYVARANGIDIVCPF